MISVKKGDVVAMRDGRCIQVTEAADQDPDAYRWYSYRLGRREDGTVFDEEYVAAELPVETIFMGYAVHPELLSDPNLGEPGYEPKIIVSDMSEVVSIIE